MTNKSFNDQWLYQFIFPKKGSNSFGVPLRFALHSLYLYCIVGPALELDFTIFYKKRNYNLLNYSSQGQIFLMAKLLTLYRLGGLNLCEACSKLNFPKIIVIFNQKHLFFEYNLYNYIYWKNICEYLIHFHIFSFIGNMFLNKLCKTIIQIFSQYLQTFFFF